LTFIVHGTTFVATLRGQNSGSLVVPEDHQKFGWTTKDDDSSGPMDYHKIWE